MKKLFYVSYYDTAEYAEEQRNFVLSAANKMDYLISAIRRNGWDVEIVSASRTAGKKNCPGRLTKLSDGVALRLFPSLGTGGILRRLLRTVQSQFHLFSYLMRNTSRTEPVLVYHSLGYARTIALAKKLKNFRLILEVEEIYADVIGNEKARAVENRLFQAADAYLFSTELLDETVNLAGKPSAVCYGTYQVGPSLVEKADAFGADGKIHGVYAGTLDPRKGGAQAALAAENLPDDYFVHILGFGSEEDHAYLQKTLERSSEAHARYDGLLRGDDYIRFLQSCQIGLSTQSPNAGFNDTSFPSKVLSYLANGLRVVSIRIRALERSSIAGLLSFYDEDTPEAIAAAIQRIDLTQPYDSRAVIRQLDADFTNQIGLLLAGGDHMKT